MRKFRFSYLVSCLMVVALCVGFASCSEDDETKGNGEIKGSNLVGTWECTWNKGYLREQDFEEDNEEWDEPYTDMVVTFKSDGTAITIDEGDVDSFRWTLSGNKLTMIYDDEYDDSSENTDVFTIKTLTKDKLVIFVKEGNWYYDEYTYKRK